MANITGNCNTIFINQGNLHVQNGYVLASSYVTPGTYVSLGQNAGTTGDFSVSIGQAAGNLSQGSDTVAIGTNAGNSVQGNNAVAIGFEAAENNQNAYAIAIGSGAGAENQGYQSIAIGRCAGMNDQHANTVVIGNYIDTLHENSAYIGNLRNNTFADGLHAVMYDPVTSELTHAANGLLTPGTYTKADLVVSSTGHIVSVAANTSVTNTITGNLYVTGTAHVGGLEFDYVNLPETIDVGTVRVHDSLLSTTIQPLSNTATLGTPGNPWANVYAQSIIPASDNVYTLGTEFLRYQSIHVGPGTIFIQDQNNTGLNCSLTVRDGVLQINGANQLQVGDLRFVDNTIQSTLANVNIEMGYVTDTADLVFNRDTRAFKDLYVSGNIFANNHVYEVQTQTLVVGDKFIGIGQNDVGLVGQSGIIINNPGVASQNVASYFNLLDQSYHLGFTSSNLSPNNVTINAGTSLPLVVHGNVTATNGFFGDGSSLTGITGATPGTYGNAYVIPQITVGSSGRISSITDTPISFDGILTQNNLSTQNIYCASMTLSGSLSRQAPVNYNSNAIVQPTDTWIIVDTTAISITLTLPSPAVFTGREIHLRHKGATVNHNHVFSSASNVLQFDGTVSNVILDTKNGNIPASWCTLVSDGTHWVIMAGL